MDHLQLCAKAFEHLLDIKCHIIIGRRGKLTELNLFFEPTEFHHLIGLHKLPNLRLARGNSEKFFPNDSKSKKSKIVDWVIGAEMILSTEDARKINGFSTEYYR